MSRGREIRHIKQGRKAYFQEGYERRVHAVVGGGEGIFQECCRTPEAAGQGFYVSRGEMTQTGSANFPLIILMFVSRYFGPLYFNLRHTDVFCRA